MLKTQKWIFYVTIFLMVTRRHPKGFSAIEVVLVVVFLILLVGVGWYIYAKRHDSNKLSSTTPTTQPANKNTSAPKSSVDTLTSTVTQNSVTLKIYPNKGPVGTKLTVTITGLADTNNVNLRLEDSAKGTPNEALAIKPEEIKNGSYSGTYTIPSTVLAAANGAQNAGPETATAKGIGSIILSHGNDSTTLVTIPYTVE